MNLHEAALSKIRFQSAQRSISVFQIAGPPVPRCCVVPLLLAGCTVAALCAPPPAAAALIVDTGTPGAANRFTGPKYAGEFTVDVPVVVSGVYHYMGVEQTGPANLLVYPDGGDVPQLFPLFQTFQRNYTAAAPDWRGTSGLSWELGPGSYWVAVEPLHGGSLVARSYQNPPSPLANEAKTISGQGGAAWFPEDTLNFAWQIEADAVAGGGPVQPDRADRFHARCALLLPQRPRGAAPWFDPIAATGYVYKTNGLSNFLEVGLPAALPDTDGLYTVLDAVNGETIVAAGASYEFPHASGRIPDSGHRPAGRWRGSAGLPNIPAI